MYEIGAVLFWKNNAFQSDGVIKDRYFIYLGSSSQISFHVNIYTVTTTSRTYYYQSGGSRDEHSHFKLEGGTFGLPEDSIVDINLNYMPYHSETVSDAAPDIQQVGKIDCEALKAIYKLVTFSRKVPPKEKFDIYSCFVECGISGIERPKKQKKRRGKF